MTGGPGSGSSGSSPSSQQPAATSSFPCTGCGACCRALTDKIGLPHFEGHCVFLDGDHCTIYENRPLVCRVDDFWENLWFAGGAPEPLRGKTRAEWYDVNARYCNDLQEREGLDKKYRLKVIR
jgi:uncharacterized protein